MRIIASNSQNPDASAIDAAVSILRNGEIIAYLTDTLYGLGGDARSTRAIEKIFKLKGRAAEKALPVIIGGKTLLKQWVEQIPPIAQALIDRFWPGPLTLVFTASSTVPPELIGNTGKIAIRFPAAPLACEISKKLGAPIIATSANRSGEPVANSAQEIAALFGDRVAIILDSGLPVRRQPSTLIDVTAQPPRLLRAGAVPMSEITEHIGELRS